MNNHLNYLDTYWYRVTKMGTSHKLRELNASIIDFEKYLAEHPSSENVIIDGQEELVSIISNKQDENKMTKKVLTRLTSLLNPGIIMEWRGLKWIAYFKENNPNEAYYSNLVVQCNNVIKWISPYGAVKESPCYVVGNMISSIKSNFRTWNGMITPQPNQFLDMIIPSNSDIDVNKRFIMSGRAWIVVDYDITSVPGVMYVSLTENKIDRIDDDSILGIAEYDSLNSYTISTIEDNIEVVLGTDYLIYPRVCHNGELVENIGLQYEIVDELTAVATIINGGVKITGIMAGTTSINISLAAEPTVALQIPINVVATTTKAKEYGVLGNDTLKLGLSTQYALYEINSTEATIPVTSFTVDKPTYVSGAITNGILVLTANEVGLTGDVMVTLTNSGPPEVSAVKTITIRSLW